jgi:hypothetical protein
MDLARSQNCILNEIQSVLRLQFLSVIIGIKRNLTMFHYAWFKVAGLL